MDNGIAPEENFAAVQAIGQYRELLRIHSGGPLDEAASAALAQATDRLAAQYARDKDPLRSLEIIALISLAVAAKVEAAKKVHLSPDRWLLFRAAPLVLLPSDIEREAAVTRLKSIKASWIGGYLVEAACEKENGQRVRKLAAKFAAKKISTASDLLLIAKNCLNQSELRSVMDVCLELTKLLQIHDPTGFGKAFEQLVNSIPDKILKDEVPEDISVHTQKLLLAILDHVARTDPLVLLDISIFKALERLFRLSATPNKAIGKIRDQLLGKIWTNARLIFATSRSFDREKIAGQLKWLSDYLPLRTVATRYYPHENFDEVIAPQPLNPKPADSVGIDGQLQDRIADLIRLVLINNEHVNSDEAGDVSACAATLANLTHVFIQGEVGDVVSFDPINQHLVEHGAELPSKVIIRVPGIGAKRSDGTTRIIQKQLVESH